MNGKLLSRILSKTVAGKLHQKLASGPNREVPTSGSFCGISSNREKLLQAVSSLTASCRRPILAQFSDRKESPLMVICAALGHRYCLAAREQL